MGHLTRLPSPRPLVATTREKVQRFVYPVYLRLRGHQVQMAAGHKIVCRTRGGPKGATISSRRPICTAVYDCTRLFPPNVLLYFVPETLDRAALTPRIRQS